MPRFFIPDNPPFNKKKVFFVRKESERYGLEIHFPPFFFLYPLFLWIRFFLCFMEEKRDLVHIHEALDFWAELDLNQRRHIVNEFTVRPH